VFGARSNIARAQRARFKCLALLERVAAALVGGPADRRQADIVTRTSPCCSSSEKAVLPDAL